MCSIFPAATARRRSVRIICRMRIPCLRQMNRIRNCAIVSSIIAATFTFILRTHDRLEELTMAELEPPEDQGNRTTENAAMLGFFVVLVAAGGWLLGPIACGRKGPDCAATRR